MQAPMSPDEDRTGGFETGGWAAPYYEGVMEQVKLHAMSEPYDMVFGRTTYDQFAGYWPNVPSDDAVGARMNSATKHVASTRGNGLDWQNSHHLGVDAPTAVKALKEKDGPLLQIHGSWRLIQSLLAHDLIDEFRLWTFPVIVGEGKRLFEIDMPVGKLDLIKAAHSPSGVTMGIYRRRR